MTIPRLRRSAGIVLLLLCAGAMPLAALDNPWSRLAKTDIRAFHQAILDNHPGPIDPQNPDFRVQLEHGYRQALGRAAKTTTFEGYAFALAAFANGLHDDHLWAQPLVQRTVLQWPGFTVARQGGRYVVVRSSKSPESPDLPPAGSEIVSCEGRTPETMMREATFTCSPKEAAAAPASISAIPCWPCPG